MGTLYGGIWGDGEGQGKMGAEGKEQKQWLGISKVVIIS